jgi:hypothetical protein
MLFCSPAPLVGASAPALTHPRNCTCTHPCGCRTDAHPLRPRQRAAWPPLLACPRRRANPTLCSQLSRIGPWRSDPLATNANVLALLLSEWRWQGLLLSAWQRERNQHTCPRAPRGARPQQTTGARGGPCTRRAAPAPRHLWARAHFAPLPAAAMQGPATRHTPQPRIVAMTPLGQSWSPPDSKQGRAGGAPPGALLDTAGALIRV